MFFLGNVIITQIEKEEKQHINVIMVPSICCKEKSGRPATSTVHRFCL